MAQDKELDSLYKQLGQLQVEAELKLSTINAEFLKKIGEVKKKIAQKLSKNIQQE